MTTQTAQVPLDLPPIGSRSRRELLLAEARALDQSFADLQVLVDRVASEFASNQCASFTRYDPMGRAEGLYRLPERLFAGIVDRVAMELSPTDRPLVLHVDELREFYFRWKPHASRVPFTCVDLVERLLSEFEPRALDLAHQQAAHMFARVFGLKHQKPRKVVAGCMVLEHGASVDAIWSPARYGPHAKENIREHLEALATCLPFADPSVDRVVIRREVEEVLQELERRSWVPERDFRGGVAGVQIRLFQTAVKYHFPLAHVEALNLFCVQHAPDYFAGR